MSNASLPNHLQRPAQTTHTTHPSSPLVVPNSLRSQLEQFRRHVWLSKFSEALTFGLLALILAFLVVFVLDRFFDTPRTMRWAILGLVGAAWLSVPWALHRWVWSQRRLDQLARLMRRRESRIGDQLLGVIELAHNEAEQSRSRTLCAAAIEQVAQAAQGIDFRKSAPHHKLKLLSGSLGLASVSSLGLAFLVPLAASNAWQRFVAPWKSTPRFTFANVQPLSHEIVVAHGEQTPLSISLLPDSQWSPTLATLRVNNQPALRASLDNGNYMFDLPPLMEPTEVHVQVGDYYQSVSIQPMLRPELVGVTAKIDLPPYMERPHAIEMDVRSGMLSAVEGSHTAIAATASRALQTASVNEQSVQVSQASFSSPSMDVQADERLSFQWQAVDGLSGREPFQLDINPVEDQAPTVVSQDLPRQAVVLESEQLNFLALAADDYGIKQIGISWNGAEENVISKPLQGEKLLSIGGPENTSMQVAATFSATSLGIPAQPLEIRLWTEDYLPGRERVYSPPHILFVLTAEQHAIWITEQMSKWHRASLDVRDRELQLHEANKQIRATSREQLADEEFSEDVRRQAAAEAANARRLASLSKSGEELLRQAARNPEIGVGHLDRWAEMLQILHDISANRMPSVADLLDKASTDKLARSDSKKKSGPTAGNLRGGQSGKSEPSEPKDNPEQPTIPKIVDAESSYQPPENLENEDPQKPKKKNNGTRQGLPITTLAGPAPKSNGDKEPEEEEVAEDENSLDKALVEQADLLAEFERIADELNAVLANLEGSTIVKRLKAAAREQNSVAESIGTRIGNVFGRANRVAGDDQAALNQLAGLEEKSSQAISYIMDDIQSYFERRRMNQFKVVLDDMKSSEVLVAIRDLSEDIPKEHGLSIAQAEYWSDTLDRWAEDLVDPACSGQCPGCKTSDSLPPSVILEVLQILEGEVNLREATRVAEQARPGLDSDKYRTDAHGLASTQSELRNRTDAAIDKIVQLPEGEARFGKEISLLSQVSAVMSDAQEILATPETGSTAIAAETEAIELLLQCKRINPKGGGGGGSSPGGGGNGTTQDSALALLGSGLNSQEHRESRDVTQTTGESGRNLPEEFRGGLDAYFERLEQIGL
ncbi:MAG: hypothetical protein KDB03_15225 [Planctomycetales bacterium]|nr:hypothetical protein [Planctomycetales bacterium]